MILGPKSRAGLIAQPVGPPIPKPIPATKRATGKAEKLPNSTQADLIWNIPITKTKVATVSTMKF